MARVVGREYGNVLLRKEQYRISDDGNKSAAYAKNMIIGKVFNCRWSIERTLRDHAHRVDTEKLKGISGALYDTLPKIDTASALDEIRGIEGIIICLYGACGGLCQCTVKRWAGSVCRVYAWGQAGQSFPCA